jgi:hypothetical protein
MTDWITDRPPTEADGDCDGDVLMQQRPGKEPQAFVHWSHACPGVPWKRTAWWRPPAQPQPEPRRFASLTPLVHPSGPVRWVAVDQDGRGWWMTPGDSWVELLPLPTREEQP